MPYGELPEDVEDGVISTGGGGGNSKKDSRAAAVNKSKIADARGRFKWKDDDQRARNTCKLDRIFSARERKIIP